MMRVIFLIISLNLFLLAQCSYELHVDFDFKKKQIKAKAKLYDNQKSILLNTTGFNIIKEEKLKEALQNGANKVSFSFTKALPKLNESYIYLLDNWYPVPNEACFYTLTSNLDKNYTLIYERTSKKIQKLSLIASKDFIKSSKKYNDITIETFFLNDDKILAQEYLNKTIEYIKLFEKRIAPFPYKRFSVVENLYQTGYAMPTFTLIGSRLLKKPYILNQSLAHEIAHQYFGNSVFNDFSQGNWIEGMTTYLADDYLKMLHNQDIAHRKSVITEYTHFVHEKNEFPIKDFQYRFNKPSMLIGYSKLSFVFHMLKNKIGHKKFNTLIQKLYKEYAFKELNLEELAYFFNTHTQVELQPFFDQWFNKNGLIDFEIKNLKNTYKKGRFLLTFDLIQNSDNLFEFELPLRIETYDETIQKTITIKEKKQRITLKTNSEPLNITLDSNIELFRTLSIEEKPLSIAAILNDKDLLAVVDIEDYEQYTWIKKLFPHIHLVNSDVVTFQDLKKHSVIFLGAQNSVLQHIYPQKSQTASSYMKVYPHAYNSHKNMMVLHARANKNRYFFMMKHYSKYKEVIFTKHGSKKKLHETQNGMTYELNSEPLLKVVKKQKSLKDIAPLLKTKRVIYVSESHDNFSHHLNQLRVIKALHKENKNIAIGMEMFQTDFQSVLDEYIQTDMSLNEFLKRSEYFKRWKFDYNLYRPIIDYAKEHRIPIIALNIDRSITRKVGKNGLLNLTKKERASLPKTIDQSNQKYKKSLEAIFNEHPGVKSNPHSKAQPNLDYFYQSQLIWDEIMAENIAKYLQNNTNKTMIVLAGSGHIENHYGIPSRVYRHNQLPYQVILNDRDSMTIGDITIENKMKTSLQKPHKLGVYLNLSSTVLVQRVIKDSFAQKVGLQKGDELLKINGQMVSSIEDIKRILYFVDNMEAVLLQIKREQKIIDLKIKE